MSKARTALLGLVVLVGLAALCEAQDITRLLRDRNFVNRQVKCVVDGSPCDMTGKQLLGALPEVLLRNCAQCNPQQATNARKLISFMKENYRKEWQIIAQRYGVQP